ncbi:MAG: ubiquitin-like domain-containing protein, partial [Candidatus Parcubacteria bacterium]|nr:ubiquitin-like domain-containing protein [Candidatus Parcubacteria bacterium]
GLYQRAFGRGSCLPKDWHVIKRRFKLWPLLGVIALVVALALAYRLTQRVVTLDINGVSLSYRTHQRSVSGVLRELGLTLRPEDRYQAISDADLLAGEPIRITLARSVFILHDGSVDVVHAIARSVSEVLSLAKVPLGEHDEVLLGDTPVLITDPLPQLEIPQRPSLRLIQAAVNKPLRLSVRRAVPVSVTDGAMPAAFYSTAHTIGQALYEQGIWLYEGDRIYPPMDDAISPGLNIIIERSKPVVLDVGGTARMLRTRLSTVSDLLRSEQVIVNPKDYVTPDPRTAISSDLAISVVRVRDEYEIDDTPIPYQTRWEADPTLELDARDEHLGLEGIIRSRIRVRYENDVAIYRTKEEEWVARKPQDHIYEYGTNIVIRTLETPDGTITYWRKMQVYITSYSPSDSGTPFDSPWFGYTFLGLKATRGIIAVDPGVLDLGTWLYVPGYGKGLAGDTGGMIAGRHIDLCYDDYNYVNWSQWGDVYLLTPVPDYVNPILPGEGPPADVGG